SVPQSEHGGCPPSRSYSARRNRSRTTLGSRRRYSSEHASEHQSRRRLAVIAFPHHVQRRYAGSSFDRLGGFAILGLRPSSAITTQPDGLIGAPGSNFRGITNAPLLNTIRHPGQTD